jgi:fibronectin type 3 domain-containing protein
VGEPRVAGDGVQVERSTDGVLFDQAAVVTGPFAGGFTNAGLATATTYHYRVRATTAAGDTPYSGRATATAAASAPVAPLSVRASAVAGSSTSVQLTWADNSTNESRFRIYRSTNRVGRRRVDREYTVNTGASGGAFHLELRAATTSAGTASVDVLVGAPNGAAPAGSR